MVRLSAVWRQVEPLVSSGWLLKALGSNLSNVRVLEASWPNTMDQYKSSHIATASYYDLSHCAHSDQYRPRGYPGDERQRACWTEYLQGELGLHDDSHVVCYDRGSNLMAARAWWLFRVFGHYKVSVLDGGWKKWQMEEMPTEEGPIEQPAQRGTIRIRTFNDSLVRSFEDMVRISEDGSAQIVDARKWENYTGEAEEPAAPTVSALAGAGMSEPESMQRGHLPGALHLLEENVLDKETNCLLPEDQLREVFRQSGVDLYSPMVSLCYNGFAACLLALAAATCSKKDVAVYPGSWTEFGQRAQQNQVVQGPRPNGELWSVES